MSSIKIISLTSTFVVDTIKMVLVYEANFNASEVAADAAFVPTLIVTPGASYLEGQVMGMAIVAVGKGNAFVAWRKEVVRTLPTLRPRGSAKVTETVTLEEPKASFWEVLVNPDVGFSIPGAALDARLNLDLEVCSSRSALFTGLLGAAPPPAPPIERKNVVGGGTFSAEPANSPAGEQVGNLFDRNANTKWLTWGRSATVYYTFVYAPLITGYRLTSANDSPERDPRDWVFEATNNGTDWFALDSRSGETFSQRSQQRDFHCELSHSLRYRLRITANNGGNEIQLAELGILGE